MKLLGKVPRASWFPAIFVGVPSCQTDWLFTNDPVNQKSPSKALLPIEMLQELNPFDRDQGMVGRRTSRWQEEASKTGMDQRLSSTGSKVLGWHGSDHCIVGKCSAFNKQSMCVDTLGATHATLLSGKITSELPFPRAGIFISRKFQSRLLPFFFHFIFLNEILNLTIRGSKQKFWVAISGNSLVPRKTGFFPVLVLIEITGHSLLPLIQGSVLNWAIDLESSFLYKTIQQERHSKERWGLKGLEPYLTHIPFLIVKNSTEKLQNQCQPHISGDRGIAIHQRVEAPSFYRGSPARILRALAGPHRCFIVEVQKPARKLSPPTQGPCTVSGLWNCSVFQSPWMCIHRGRLSWEEARAREVLCPENPAPPGSTALSGLPKVLLEIFVHFMAEFQGHSGFTGFLQACIHDCIQHS